MLRFVQPVKREFMWDAKLRYGRGLHAGHELIKWRPIYDVVDVWGGGTIRQELMKMEICEAAGRQRSQFIRWS